MGIVPLEGLKGPKIAFIGAGSVVFARTLISDILSTRLSESQNYA